MKKRAGLTVFLGILLAMGSLAAHAEIQYRPTVQALPAMEEIIVTGKRLETPAEETQTLAAAPRVELEVEMDVELTAIEIRPSLNI